MRLPENSSRIALVSALAFVLAIPAIGQDSPESILPPGFGDAVDEPDQPRDSGDGNAKPARPPKLDLDLDASGEPRQTARPSSGGESTSRSASGSGAPSTDLFAKLDGTEKDGEEGEGEEDGVRTVGLRELPPEAERSTDVVGVIGANGGDMGLAGFYGIKGQFLENVMRKIDAPIASRWASIVLRRALLSQTATPADVNGADWVAERAWLLLRMGEADPARMLVQAVDTDKYTPKMMQVAMQAALASGDPGGICPIAQRGMDEFKEPSWTLARAMCHGLSGETAQGNALIDRLRDQKKARGIDVLLAEKVVSAGANSRRAIVIQWEQVEQLTAWRYGLSNAVGVDIPARLYKTAGSQVNSWQSRSPLLSFEQRISFAEQGAAMGVISGPALADLYGAWFESVDASERGGKPFQALRNSFIEAGVAKKIVAMKALWDAPNLDPRARYARLILTSQAAARITPAAEIADDSERLIASMLSAGLDKQAARWARVVQDESNMIKGRALLAVGAPKGTVEFSAGLISSYKGAAGENGAHKVQLLFAALAGLGQLTPNEINNYADDYEVPVGRRTRWTQALDLAVSRNAKAAVALIGAAGLQTRDWSKVPAAHLYHIVSALRRVGMEPEARMIAAEALTRA